MLDFFAKLFDTSGFPPRWYCGDWTSGHGWLHIVSDLGVWGAYLTIPLLLIYFTYRRRDLPFRVVFLLFGAFILACGTTHLMEAIIFWWPAYRLAGVIKLATAVVSWGTVIALVPTVPQALSLRSPQELEREIEERKKVESELRSLQADLERRVADRTAELAEVNASLKAEILERQRTEEALREQREWLRVTLESIGDAVIATDTQQHVTLLNPVAQSLTGWDEPDALGRPLSEVFRIINEETRKQVVNPADRALREGVIVGLANHTLLVARDGTERAIDDSAAPIRKDNGNVAGVVLVFRDVTDRRRAEQASAFLANASVELAALVDVQSTLEKLTRLAVPFVADWCAVDLLNQDGTLTPLAIAHQDAQKVELARQLKSQLSTTLVPPAEEALSTGEAVLRDIDEALLESLTNEQEHLETLKSLRLKSSIHVPLIVRGRPLGVLAFVTAESGRAYGPEDLSLAQDLARRASVAIENAELYRELREADARKDEFLAMLGHELRNPLAPIRSGLELLTLRGEPDETLGLMKEQVDHMVRLVDDLLDVSRIMRGKIELRPVPVDLVDVARRAIDMVQPQVRARNHALSTSLPAEPIMLEADPVRLVQVLANLLQNAVKFTEPQGEISLSVTREDDLAIVRVADNGLGIDRELLPRIFDLFTQADRSVERTQGGLGIGLTLVRNLVEMHGGSVEARSPGLGQGSEFVVRLPIHATHAPGEPTRSEPVPIKPRRVLLVDDNIGAAKMMGILLKRLWNHEVDIAHDGFEALEIARQKQPEVVLLDIGLPGMSGYELARRMRREEPTRHALLVALTGYGQDEDRRRSFDVGIDEHLVKPVSPARLEAVFAHPKLNP